MRISKVSKLIAGALAGVLLVAGFGGAALAAPSDVSEARGQFIRTNSTVLDGLLAARGATAEYPSGTFPVANQPLTGAILQQIVGQLEGSSAIGSSGVLTLGAASQYAQALPDGTARAGSGAVTSANGLILGGTGAPGANASLNLTPLISRAGASTALSQAQLSLGALGSTIESQGGAVTSDYLIGDAGITITSPLVSGVYNQLRTQVTGLQTSVDNLETAARTSILNYLNGLNAGVLRATATVNVTEPNLTALLPTGAVGSGTGVSVNLSTGQVVIDLEQLLASDPALPDINDLPPNTSLLDGAIGAAVVRGITTAITTQVNATLTNVRAAVESTRLDADIELQGRDLFGTWQNLVGLELDAPLSAISNGSAKFALTGAVPGLLTTVLGLIGISLNGLLTGVTNSVLLLVGNLLSSVTAVETALNTTVGGLATNVGTPVLTALRGVADLTANVQPATGDLGNGSSTVRALDIALLGSLVRLDLASSTVRGTTPDYQPTLALSPGSVTAGGTTTVTGSGYAPLETVTLTGAGTTKTVTADASGGFTTPVTVPAGTGGGTYAIRGAGALSAASGTANLQVTTPTITATTPVYRGAETAVTGSGFLPGETVSLTRGGTAAGTTTADGTGQISTSIGIPPNAPTGSTAITASGGTSGGTATTATTVLAYDPAISASPTAVQAGQTTTVTGLGFAPNEAVTITAAGATTTTQASASGRISAPVTVPNGRAAGPLEISAVGAVSNASRTATIAVLPYTPTLTVDPGVAEQGTSTTVSGSGFAAGEAVTVDFDGTSRIVFASPTGTFSFTLAIAEDASVGAGTVTAIGAVSNAPVTAPLAVVSGEYLTEIVVDPGVIEPGETTQVTGSGFEPGETGTVVVAGQTVAFTADTDGGFSVPVTIPVATTPGDYSVVATGDESQTPASAALEIDGFAPVLSADPAALYPGQQTTISGSGFPANTEVVFDFGGAGAPIPTTSDGAGAASVTYTVPNAQLAGPITVTATTAAPETSGTTTLTALAYAPALSLTPTSGPAGTVVGFVGVGFAPNETVTVAFPGVDTVVSADADGEIDGTFTVPGGAAVGADPVTATGAVSGTPASSVFTVDATIYTPTLTLDPATLLAGEQTTISGTGFAPGETVGIDVAGVTVSPTADGDGAFSTVYTVPAGTPAQSYTVTAEGSTSQTPTTAVLDVEPIVYAPEIAAAPSTITAGQTTVVTGDGFAPGENVTVAGAGQSVTTVADGSGAVSVELTVPATTVPATYTVTASGATSTTPATTSLVVEPIVYTTALALDPDTVLDGESTILRGSGFAPNESVTVEAFGSTITLDATGSGDFETTIAVPAGTPAGAAVVLAVGDVSATPAAAELTVENAVFDTAVTASPNPVLPGGQLSVSGTGFAPGETVAIDFAGATASVTADGDGAFETSLTVPPGTAPADYQLVATGDQSQTAASAAVAVAPVYSPFIALDPASIGQTGSTTIDGSGFAPGESVTVTIDGEPFETVSASDTGTFSLAYDPPTGAPLGSSTVVATGAVTAQAASATLTIVSGDYAPEIAAAPDQQIAGQPVTITGTGFEPGETVTVRLGDATVSTPATPQGTISTPITVPPGADLGSLLVTATGDESQTPTTTTVTVVPVPVYATTVTAAPDSIAPGGTSVITGAGFIPGETVVYSFNGVLSTIVADGDGGFTLSVSVPTTAPAGPLPFQALGQQSQTPASDEITVQDVDPVYEPSISPDPASVPQGGSTTIRGSGFAPGESVEVTLFGTTQTVDADADGAFALVVDVPADEPLGAAAATAVGAVSDEEATTEVTVTDGAYSTSVAATPDPASPGSTVTVTGTGFEPGELIDVSVGGATAVATANGDGAFSTPVTLPATATGTLPVSAEGRTSATPAASTLTVASQPVYFTGIVAEPASGTAGSVVAVTGEGFAAGETVTLALAGVSFTTTADGDGRIETELIVPASAVPGATTISAEGAVSATPAETGFTVLAPQYDPSITVAPGQVTAGGQLVVSGEGFAPGESVAIVIAGATAEATADPSGAFTANVTVPAGTAPGGYPLSATGAVSNEPVSQTVTVQAPVYAPSISVSPTSVEAGAAVTVSGVGFAPNETVDIAVGGAEGTVQANASGAFSTPVVVPAGTPAGSTAVSALGEVSATQAATTVEVTSIPPVYAPVIALVPASAPQGGSTTLTGAGFAPGETVTISVFGSTITAGADQNGDVTESIPVPDDATLGATTVTASGSVSGTPTSAQLTVTEAAPVEYGPVTTVSPSSAAAGDAVTLAGAGFAPDETVTITIGGASTEVRTDGNGAFTTPVAIPAGTTPGAVTITSVGAVSTTPAESTVSITAPVYAPVVAVAPGNGAPGSTAQVSGSGYAPGDAVTITIGGVEVGTATANGSGAFTAPVTVPADAPAGPTELVATGATAGSAAQPFTVDPVIYDPFIVADPATVEPGGTTAVLGTGFAPGESVTVVLFGTEQLVTADGDGAFSADFTAPGEPGAYSATAIGAVSDESVETAVTVADGGYTTALVVSPSNVTAGDAVAVTGTGYEPGETVTVTVGGATQTVTADGDGGFTASFTIPVATPAGTLGVSAVGTTSQSPALGAVVVQAVPVPAPAVVSASPSSAQQGAPVTVSGSGFAPGESVAVSLAGAATSATADADGAFSVVVTVPVGAPTGPATATATGDDSGRSASAPVDVTGAVYTPVVSVSPGTAPQGGSVVVSGTGFQPGEDVSLVLGDGTAVTGTADGSGRISVTLPIPVDAEPGATAIAVTGALSGATASTSVTVEESAPPVYDPSIATGVGPYLPGATVPVSGVGFAPGETVTIAFAGGTATAEVGSDGRFATAVTVPADAEPGALPISASGPLSGDAEGTVTVIEAPAAFDPAVSAAAGPFAPGSSVPVSGIGFAPGETVTVTLLGVEVEVVADADGSFSTSITVPADAAAGAATLSAVGGESNDPATVAVTISAAPPVYATDVTVSPAEGLPGDQVTIVGTGFAPNETVSVLFAGQRLAATASATGAFSLTATIPTGTAPGTYQVTATGEQSQTPAAESVLVDPIAYDPFLTAAPASVAEGASTVLSGAGFAPGEQVDLSLFGEERSVLADANGAFTASFAVPAGTPVGPVTATAEGLTSQQLRSTTVTVVSGDYEPEIVLDPGIASPGGTITVGGSGFEPGETVEVAIGGTTVGSGVAGQDGAISIPVVVPATTPGGPVSVVATGADSATPASATLQIAYDPTLIADPVSVQAGGSTVLRGSGYAPGEQVTLSLLGQNRTVTADAAGGFASTFLVADDAALGATSASALGTVSGVPRTASVTVVAGDFDTAISLEPVTAAPGEDVVVSGDGFAAGETVTVTIGGQTVGSGTAAEDGSIAITITVPSAATAGPAQVIAQGATSLTPAAASLAIAYDPFLAAAPISVAPGGSTVLTGSGYAPGESVTLTLFGETRTIAADADGGFTATFTAPAGITDDTATATAYGAVSQEERTTVITIVDGSFETAITLDPTTAAPGDPVEIEGAGFQPGETVTVTIGGQPAGSGTAGADGSVTITVTVPSGLPAGPTEVVATGAQSAAPAGGTLQIAYDPTLAVEPITVAAGDAVTVSGSGFAAGETVELALFGESRSVTADADGGFAETFIAPDELGPQTATASGSVSQQPRSAQVTVVSGDYATAIEVLPGSAAPGDPVTVGGSGFEPGETVTVTIGGQDVGTGTAGPDGAVAIVVTVPIGLPSGPTPVVATGGTSQTPANGTLEIVYTPFLSADPVSVAQGGTTVLNGSGFAPGEDVSIILFGETRVVEADEDGAFAEEFTARDDEALGATSATAEGDLSQTPASASVSVVDGSYEPEITIEPGTAAPGGTVVIGGSGFEPGETVTVTIGGQDVGSGTAGADGSVTIPVTVPGGLPAGPAPVTVVGDQSATPAGGTLVVAYQPSFTAAPLSVQAGGDVLLSGSGYAPGETVVLTLFGETRSITVGTDGTFVESFTAPSGLGVGDRIATATGTVSGGTLTATVAVTAGDYDTIAVVIPGSAAPGDVVTVVGSGYQPGETVAVEVGGEVLGTGTAGADGTVTIVITVPSGLPAGPVQVVVTGDESDTPAAGSLVIAYDPFLTAVPISAAPGGDVELRGTGYASGELVTLELFGEVRVVTADAAGAFTAVFTTPADAEGAATATASGELSQIERSVEITIVDGVYEPVVTIEPGTAAPGDQITVGGSGFEPGETVTVTIGGQPVGSGTVGADGSVTIPVTVPGDLPAGPNPVVVVGDQSGTPAGGTLIVQPAPAPTLVVSPSDAAPGESVSVVGAGYEPGETVTVTIDGTAVSATVVVGPDGTFVVTLTVPLDAAAGDYTVTGAAASGTAAAPLAVEDAPPVYDPAIVVAPGEVAPGDAVVVSGSGFAPGESVVVSLAGATVTVTAGPDGRFTAELTVPDDVEPGAHPVTAVGGTAGTALAEVVVADEPAPPVYDPSIVVSPGTVAPGDELTVAGSGYAPGELITVSVGGVSVQVQAGPDGAFAATLTVPASATPGAYTVTAVGLAAGTASAPLTVEAGAEPPVYAPTIEVAPGSATAGSSVTVTGAGFAPGEDVTVAIAGQTYSVVADADGAFTLQVQLPATVAVGDYTVVAIGDESAVIASAALTVTAPVPGGGDDGGEGPGTGTPGTGTPGTGQQPGASFPSTESGGGGIPGTGAESFGTALLAALLLLVGTGVAIGGHRRRRHSSEV